MASIELVISQTGNPPPGGYTFGPREDIVTGSLLNIVNSPTGNQGVTLWFWELVDQPATSNIVFAAPNTVAQSFTPLVAGSYLIELTINNNIVGRVRVGIESATQLRTTAVGEATEASLAAGWARNQQLNVERLSGQQYARDLFNEVANTSVAIGSDPLAPVTVTEPNHLATKFYVDAVATGLDPKQNTRTATHGTIVDLTPGSCPSAAGGVTIITGDRIAVTSQGIEPASAHINNGIYVAQNAGTGANDGTWIRSTDADENAEVTAGLYFKVTEGTFMGWEFMLITPDPIVIGVTALEFAVTPTITLDHLYNTIAGTNIRDTVYLSGSDEVQAGDATGIATMPIVGFVVSKPTATTCRVRSEGELGGFAGLVPLDFLYADTIPGALNSVNPSAADTVIQKVARAKNATTILIMIDHTTVVN